MPRLVAGLATLALTLLAILLAGEATVRLWSRYGPAPRDPRVFPETSYSQAVIPSANERLGWELDPAAPFINADGFRDRDYRPGAAPDTLRIVVLGDSITFGWGVPAEEGFVKVLEQALSESPGGRPYEVLNLGVGGYNTQQEVELYRVKGRRYAPDVVVLAYVLNDAVPSDVFLEMALELERGSASERGDGADTCGSLRSEFVAWIVERARRLGQRRTAPFPTWVRESHADPERWTRVRSAFVELSRMAGEDGTPVLVVIVPMFWDFERYPFEGVHRMVAGEARKHGFGVLDLYDSLKGHDVEDLRLERGDDTHPNAAAHRLIATALRDHLLASGLLAGGGAPRP
jgi:lysophospholipase L1-like esterase